MTNIITITKNNPIVFSINPESLIELKAEQDILIAKVPSNIEELEVDLYKAAKRKVGKLRIATEKERKELKAAALSYGKLVDSEAEKAQLPVAEIENVYDKLINQYDSHFAELAKIAVEKEAKRIINIENRIAEINSYTIKAFDADTSKQISDLIVELTVFIANGFDYEEFGEMAYKNEKSTIDSLNKMFDTLNSAEIQRKIDEENRLKFEAEKAAFEATQREANAKLEAERAALQKQKDDADREEKQRIQAEIDRQKELELQKQREELEKQRAIDDQNRKLAQEAELKRQEDVRLENEARKLAQEKEDRIRNAAPQLLTALEAVASTTSILNTLGIKIHTLVISSIKLAKGE